MRAIGSPPSGLSWKMAKPTKVTRNRPSSTASNWVPVNGSRYRRLRRTVSCPSGVLRSSAASAMDLPESPGRTIPRPGKSAADTPPWRPRKSPFWAPANHPDHPAKRAARRPPFSKKPLAEPKSVRRLVWGLVGRSLVGGGRRGRVDLDAVQQIVRHLQGLVVLGVRRHVGLRTGLLVALGLQM